MSALIGFFSVRNIAAVLLAIGLVYILILRSTIKTREADIIILTNSVETISRVNTENVVAIKQCEKINKEWVLKCSVSDDKVKDVLEDTAKTIEDIKKANEEKYEEFKKNLPKLGDCISPIIGDDVVRLLYEEHSGKN